VIDPTPPGGDELAPADDAVGGAGPGELDADAGAARAAGTARERRSPIGTILWLVGALLVAVLVRTFIVQMFWIPSGSMEPTLVSGDRVLVRKVGDPTHPARGDVVVFDRPSTMKADLDQLIKRVIGLPGESIAFEDGKVFINGEPLDEPYLAAGTKTVTTTPDACTRAQPCPVPTGHVWVMGDNRANSHDSRYLDVGPIDETLIVGHAFVINWPPGRLSGL